MSTRARARARARLGAFGFSLAIVMVALAIVGLMPRMALAEETEIEPNNSINDATEIPLNTMVYGAWNDDDDTYDYYKFTLPVKGTLKITFYSDTAYSNWSIYAELYPATGGESIASFSPNTNTTKGQVYTVGLSNRTYCLKLDSWNHGRGYHFKITYDVPKTSIKKPVALRKGFTAKWAKYKYASSYQVSYVSKDSYDLYGWDKAKTVKVSKKKTSCTIKKLGTKKAYYVKVRAIRTISGQKYYSLWSAKKYVKTLSNEKQLKSMGFSEHLAAGRIL